MRTYLPNPVKLEIDLAAEYFTTWPKLRVFNNDTILFDGAIEQSKQTLTFNFTPDTDNTLKIEHYGKCFGDGGVWHLDTSGKNLGEVKLTILDIRLDDVSIDYLLHNLDFETTFTPKQLSYSTEEFITQYTKFKYFGIIVFNGHTEFKYSTPIYNFLIDSKYKEPFNSEIAFYSNKTELFHYDEGLHLVNEVQELLNKK